MYTPRLRRIGAILSALLLTATMAACGGDTGATDDVASDDGDAPTPDAATPDSDATAESTESGEMTTLNMALIGIYSDASIYLGQEQGFFAEEGIELDIQQVPNPPAAIAALQGGQTDVVYTPTIPFLSAFSQGLDLRVVAPADGYEVTTEAERASVDDTHVYIAPDSDITTAADLASATVAVPARNAQLEVTIANAIAQDGGDPSTVNWVVLDFPTAAQSVTDGTVDAAGLVTPFNVEAEQGGATKLLSPGATFFKVDDEPIAVGIWVTSAETLDSKTDAMASFQRAVLKSNQFALDNYEQALEKAAEVAGLEPGSLEDPSLYWPDKVNPSDISDVAESLVELGYLDEAPDASAVIFTP